MTDITEPVYQVANDRGWSTFCRAPDEGGYLGLVQEFYANLPDKINNNVTVRGKSVPMGPDEINKLYGLISYEGDEYSVLSKSLKNSPNLDGITKVICNKQPKWKVTKGGNYMSFSARQLKDPCKMWFKFVVSRLLPRQETTGVTPYRALLLYCIVTMKSIDVGQLIHNEMVDTAMDHAKTSRWLWYPALISRLCIQVDVPLDSNETLIKVRKLITLKSIPEGSSDPEDADEPHVSDAERAPRRRREFKRAPKLEPNPNISMEWLKSTLQRMLDHQNRMRQVIEKQLREASEKRWYYVAKYYDEIERQSAAKEASRVENPAGCDIRLRKKLLVLDLNGLLMDIIPVPRSDVTIQSSYKSDAVLKNKHIYLRPHVNEFMKFCIENFDVGIWTSRMRHNLEPIIDFFFGHHKEDFKFIFDQEWCTITDYTVCESLGVIPLKKNEIGKKKAVKLKNLQMVWDKFKDDYDDNNTLLIDDSPVKALCNPAHTAIFPETFSISKLETDDSLGT
ncbi:hypothetical protein ACJIZ3_023582 [Penstemon smallii]|uniref:Mitochondrial import inner membrane translocase subunit TIM50 n=1 Tax=Penstemon smallii TaxID=265156 RepID=A0ABD3TQU5_9LAMI